MVQIVVFGLCCGPISGAGLALPLQVQLVKAVVQLVVLGLPFPYTSPTNESCGPISGVGLALPLQVQLVWAVVQRYWIAKQWVNSPACLALMS